MPQYVDTLAQAGWRIDVCAPFPFYPAWRIDRSLPAVSSEHGGAVQVTRYAPYVPRHPSAVGRALHEASIAVNAFQLLRRRIVSADLIVVTSPPPLGARCAVWIALRQGKPSLVLAYDLAADLASDTFRLAGVAGRQLFAVVESSLFAKADTIIALSDDMATRIRSLSGRSSAVPVIRIWADDGLMQLDHAAAARNCRARLGIAEDRLLIGYAGTFGRKQRLPTIVAAMGELPNRFITILVGDGPDRADMERLASRAHGEVRIMPPLSTDELHGFLSACDVSIVTAWTRHAGSLFPSKVANILAAGSPVLAITHRGTELATLLERDDVGLICPSLDPTDIVQAARRGAELGRDKHRRDRCRAYAARHFDRSAAMSRFITEVDRLVP